MNRLLKPRTRGRTSDEGQVSSRKRAAPRSGLVDEPERGRSRSMTPSTLLIEAVDGVRTVWRNGRMKRTDRVWTINAQCDPPPGERASETLAGLRPRIEAIALPADYRLRRNGEHGDSAEANANLAKALPLGFLAMVLVVVVVLFNALRQPLAIWLVVPLALVGVVAGLLVTGTALEFTALLGLLSLSGLLVKNAIVLVAQEDFEVGTGGAVDGNQQRRGTTGAERCRSSTQLRERFAEGLQERYTMGTRKIANIRCREARHGPGEFPGDGRASGVHRPRAGDSRRDLHRVRAPIERSGRDRDVERTSHHCTR